MESCIYHGWVRHRRSHPTQNEFQYPLFMVYLDLSELDHVFHGSWFWSTGLPNLAWFRRKDHFGAPGLSLDEATRSLIENKTGKRPQGPIRLLTHLRYLGYCFNPISIYYCFDRSGRKLETVVSEVTNTPYAERHCYIWDESMNRGNQSKKQYFFKKELWVSPFIEQDVDCYCFMSTPGETLSVHMEDSAKGLKFFDATLVLKRKKIEGHAFDWMLAQYPMMTGKVIAGIYWQALRLLLKGTPVYPHQDRWKGLVTRFASLFRE